MDKCVSQYYIHKFHYISFYLMMTFIDSMIKILLKSIGRIKIELIREKNYKTK